MQKMIKIEQLKDFILTIIYTGYISDEKPLSVLFIGDVGTGKSELLGEFNVNDNIGYFTDITYMGLLKLLTENKELRHIVIPDFLKITMKRKSTSDNILSCFNALVEEGLNEVSIFGSHYNFNNKNIGLISATTKNSFYYHYRLWSNIGFLSRMLVVSFAYTKNTIEEIFDYIYKREYLGRKKVKYALPIRNFEVNIKPFFAKQLRDKDTTFRSQKQFQTLALARALMHNRFEVNQQDINDVNEFKKFINTNFNLI